MVLINLGGILDISTIDVPGKASMVIFTVGCNFKCNFCHNKHLLQPNVGKSYPISKLIKIIESNPLISSVSISGGEPTLQEDLLDLCKELNKLEKYISIDTNGSNPDKIKELIPYINRVALDLKGPLNQKKLEKITGVKVNLNKIIETIDFLKIQEDLDFEIRTTFVESILSPVDFGEILKFLKEIEFKGNFVLQQYQYFQGVGEKFKELFLKPEHGVLLKLLKPYKSNNFPFKIFLRDETVGYSNIDELFS